MRSPRVEPGYRPCVGVVLLNATGAVFLGRRLDAGVEAWQLPQGGIDPGETPEAAARRELREETGVAKVSLLAQTDGWLRYDLPPDAAAQTKWAARYRGQSQKWFAYRHLGGDDEVDLATEHPEFDAWRWATAAEALARVVPFKRAVYEAVFRDFHDLLRHD